MASHGNRSWTLFGLINAFVELAFAYLLLCGSVCMFFVSSFFNVFDLYWPCPCTGFLGYRNRNLCLHKLFHDLPMRKIDYVRRLATNRFPFDVVWIEDQENESDLKLVMDRKWGNEKDLIRMLEKDLQEEKSARVSLYMELEKERAASASAADEAMAMIVRLQEEKAILEMEARQYGRMIDEKFAYDEEEMNIMKEMLVKRERENHLLEKKLEAYMDMYMLDDECSEVYPEKKLETKTSGDILKSHSYEEKSLSFNKEPIVYDVHVIDDKTELRKDESIRDTTVWTDESSSSDLPIANVVEYDRLKIEDEVKRLKERLRVVLEENDKLTSFDERRESLNAQFKHVEEMVNQLQDVQQTDEHI